MTEIDPSEAAARAMGESPPALPAADVDDVDDESRAPSASSGNSGDPSPLARLLDGSATGPSMGELKRDYELARSESLILRGVLRWAGADGMPPIGEISLGGILKAREIGVSNDAGNDGESDDEDAVVLEDFTA